MAGHPRGTSVLYVDDEPFLLEIAKKYLEKTGKFQVDTAENADTAIEILKSRTFDVIVSDYQMPGMDGIQFLQYIRKEYGNIPFILFTGKGREEVVIQAIEQGVDFYLQKGSDIAAQFAELILKIERAVYRRNTETEIINSRQRLSDIINFLPDATLVIDTEGRVIAWNYAIEEMTGVPAGEMVGKNNFEYAIPFYGERRPILIDLLLMQVEDPGILHKYSDVRRVGDSLAAETECAHIGDKNLCLWAKANLLKNSDGTVTGAIESIRDMTEYRKVNKALQASERRYRNVFESAAEAMLVVDWEAGRILDANGQAIAMYGYSLDELRTMPVMSLTPEQTRMNPFELRGMFHIHRYFGKKKDGTIFPTEVTGSVYTQKTRVIAILNIRDLSDITKLEYELRKSEDTLTKVLARSDVSHSVWSEEARLIYMNNVGYQRLNMPPGSLDGKSMVEIFGEEMGNDLLRCHVTAMLQSEPVEFEHCVGLPTGTKWFLSVGTRLYDDSGKIIGVEVVSYNTTERKQTELMLRKRIEELEANPR